MFLADERRGVPPFLELGVLLGAAERLERDEEDAEELAMLLRGGSSLGGARPKAHILDPYGRVSIAKFPSPGSDHWNVILWEAVALDLAARAGINTTSGKLYDIDRTPVLLLQRFDRIDALRIGYASAMTMLERKDGDDGSYLEIADVITRTSPRATEDLQELWRRIAFSILICNFDDHLRNHGFLRTSTAGWTLAPALDLNPDPSPGPRHLHTAIDFDVTDADIDLLMSVAAEFRLSRDQAHAILGQVSSATHQWDTVARQLGADATDVAEMTPAFEHQAAVEARSFATAA